MEAQRNNPMFAEMLSNSNETIFIEAIDQYFEEESSDCMCQSDDIGDLDFNIEKMNDKFCDSLDEGDNSTKSNIKDTSTDLDSDEASFQYNLFVPKKKLFISDYLFINQANINKIKNKVLAEYLPLTLQMQDKKGYINTQ